MGYPKINYTDDSANPQTLQFLQFPRVSIPMDLTCERAINVSSDGTPLVIFINRQEYFAFEVEVVQFGQDLDAWRNFERVAIKGQPFTFYPDADRTELGFTMRSMETTSQIRYRSPRMYTVEMRFRFESSVNTNNQLLDALMGWSEAADAP